VEGETLKCDHCPNLDGESPPASAPVSACATFMNDDGHLVCTRPSVPNLEPALLPPGPYLESCGGCEVIEEKGVRSLLCIQCINAEGLLRPSDIVLAPGCVDIKNVAGVLTCGDGTRPPTPPEIEEVDIPIAGNNNNRDEL